MCGDLETDESLLEEFYSRFVESARAVLAAAEAEHAEEQSDPLYRYLDALFRKTLTAASRSDDSGQDVSSFDRLCMEPLVFARIAGFMAAHQPLEDDPMRRLIEAVMTGYSEGEDALERYAHRHAHVHGHSHGHTH